MTPTRASVPTTLVPTLLLGLAGVILATWYPLSKKRIDENVATLEKRRIAAGIPTGTDD